MVCLKHIASKLTLIRGNKYGSVNNGYAIIGMKLDWLTSENDVYMCLKKCVKPGKTPLRKNVSHSEPFTAKHESYRNIYWLQTMHHERDSS